MSKKKKLRKAKVKTFLAMQEYIDAGHTHEELVERLIEFLGEDFKKFLERRGLLVGSEELGVRSYE